MVRAAPKHINPVAGKSYLHMNFSPSRQIDNNEENIIAKATVVANKVTSAKGSMIECRNMATMSVPMPQKIHRHDKKPFDYVFSASTCAIFIYMKPYWVNKVAKMSTHSAMIGVIFTI